MKVLITGVTGFAGSHLADYLNNEGVGRLLTLSHTPSPPYHSYIQTEPIELYGTKRRRSPLDNLQSPVELIDCELTDYPSVHHVIDKVRPDRIFHLAAQTFVPSSWDAPEYTFEVNVFSTLNILEAIRRINPEIRLMVAGSSEEYGLVNPDECPITEDQPLRPMSPYGVSKVTMDLLCQQYVKSYDLYVVITRAFNHTGPRRGEHFATSTFAKQIAEIEVDKGSPIIKVGNLDAARDFTDVRDMVRAYWKALNDCNPGEPYNICCGRAWSIREMLNVLLSLSDPKIKTMVDPSRLRPSDVPLLLGDYTKFQERTGWKPTIPFEKTLEDLLNYWRERVK